MWPIWIGFDMFNSRIHIMGIIYRGKKILKFSLVPRASTSKFLLVLLPNNLSMSRKNKLALNFLLARRTLGEKICLSCLKFYLSRAPGQVIFFTPDIIFLSWGLKKNLSVSDFLPTLLNYMLLKSFFRSLRDFRKNSTKHAFFSNLAFHNNVYFI